MARWNRCVSSTGMLKMTPRAHEIEEHQTTHTLHTGSSGITPDLKGLGVRMDGLIVLDPCLICSFYCSLTSIGTMDGKRAKE